jgi:hexosaminidase
MIDVCRHFVPADVIRNNIDAMAALKMNVLHLHLSEDQGFRIESKVFPELHELGSKGNYFTQEEIRSIIRYAADRGIRVMPEFDLPGHATSWFVGYPGLASAPGPYSIERKFGVFDPTMDPTRKSTYRFLKKFFAEMCDLFPDPYFHIGGDENNGKQWEANKEIQAFMKKEGIKNNHELQAYFNRKLLAILQKNGKKMVGWDEILDPSIPKDAVIQSWRGKDGLRAAATGGYSVILSNGYYIDLSQPAWQHYLNDPLPADINLTADEKQRVLGGEATMWTELVTRENIDSRIWPRTAAIAERLWSPAGTNNVPDMYRRLEKTANDLEEHGLRHLSYQDMMLRRLAPGRDISPLKYLASWIEPLKEYKRHHQDVSYSTDLPLSRMPDIAAPESNAARVFAMQCEQLVKGRDTSVIRMLEQTMNGWKLNHNNMAQTANGIPALYDWNTRSQQLLELADIGLQSLQYISSGQDIPDQWVSRTHERIKEIQKPVQESELAVTGSILMLFQYALPK